MACVDAVDSLAPRDQQAVSALVERCHDADGSYPLNEAARLALSRPGARHVLEHDGDTLVGYAQLADDGTAQVCVDPTRRRRGIGTRLVAALGEAMAWWSFGLLAPARGFAAAHHWRLTRELLIMARELTGLEHPEVPAGVTIRTFMPGRDDDAWVRVNARAFAHHQEQGRLDVTDLRARMAEDWFDPAGFFVAERDGDLVGFHWTKVHPAAEDVLGDGRPVGEVYVIGVDPDAAGGGLGRALLATGLAHLQAAGPDTVILYVEADQHRVVRMYESASFGVIHRDGLFAVDSFRDREASPR